MSNIPRYINADTLLNQLNKKIPEPGKIRYMEGFNDAISRVRSMISTSSTADVVPKSEVDKLLSEVKKVTEENEMYRKTVGTLLKKNGKVVGLGHGKEVEYIEKDLAETFKKMAVNRVKSDTAQKILDRAIAKSVCKDSDGTGSFATSSVYRWTEKMFISIHDLRTIVEEVSNNG